MATDGLSDAFGGDEDQFQTFARRVQERIKEYGMEKGAASIPKWLEEKKSQASGDENTLPPGKDEAQRARRQTTASATRSSGRSEAPRAINRRGAYPCYLTPAKRSGPKCRATT